MNIITVIIVITDIIIDYYMVMTKIIIYHKYDLIIQ